MNIWYSTLNTPPLTPPSEIFAPAWGILYTTIIVAFILFASKKTILDKKKGYIYFCLQIVFNLLWSPAFFWMKNMLLALIIVIILDILVFFNIKEFYRISKPAGLILIPYMLWILFATYLNIGFLLLN